MCHQSLQTVVLISVFPMGRDPTVSSRLRHALYLFWLVSFVLHLLQASVSPVYRYASSYSPRVLFPLTQLPAGCTVGWATRAHSPNTLERTRSASHPRPGAIFWPLSVRTRSCDAKPAQPTAMGEELRADFGADVQINRTRLQSPPTERPDVL